MFSNLIFKKSISTAAAVIAAVILVIPAYSQEAPVNSTDSSLVLFGGLGYGDSIYGVFESSDPQEAQGLEYGPGLGFEFGAMFNYSIFAAGLIYNSILYNNMETTSGPDYETYGGGSYRTLDVTLGLKAFTETGDMGYTYFYGGFRYWKAIRDVDFTVLNSFPQSDSSFKDELSGKGWSIGFRDYSTFPVSSFSIVLQTALMYYNAPFEKGKRDGQNIPIKQSECIGLGAELGLGVAFEDIGLSVVAGLKNDDNGTVFKYVGGSGASYVLGVGYSQFFLTLTKVISI